MKIKTLVICLIGLVKLNATAQEISSDRTLFAQGMFSITNSNDIDGLEISLKQNPNVKMFRLDRNSNVFILFTKGINELSKDELRNWFGEYEETISCLFIGESGKDQHQIFPFTNCQD